MRGLWMTRSTTSGRSCTVPAMGLRGSTRPVVVPVRVDPAGLLGPTREAGARSALAAYEPRAVRPGRASTRRRCRPADRRGGRSTARRRGGVTGWAALALGRERRGSTVRRGVVAPPSRRRSRSAATGRSGRSAGIATSEERLAPRVRTVVDGLRVVAPVAVGLLRDAVRRRRAGRGRRLRHGGFTDLVSLDELLAHPELLYHWTGIPQAGRRASSCDENAWSPPRGRRAPGRGRSTWAPRH